VVIPGGLLVCVGLVLAASGMRLATERRRPVDIGGALLAATGLLVALLGAGRLLSNDFLRF